MISSFATLLAIKCANADTEIVEYNQYITKGVERMQNLINDLLTYAQIGSDEKAFTWVDTNNLIEDVQHYLALIIDETEARIQHGNLPQIYGIEPQLGQLFYNLISNAIKFRRMEEVPSIEIGCEDRADEWLFSVKDNGLGIEKEYKDKVFVIFQRLHPADKYPGTGIGLALCKRIAERHGGSIWLESVSGSGTTVFFSIPKP
jgi:light-regulated signal transduction histidine kinase (bacteriophytochrome)